jgi:hypothetical protein
MVTRMIALLLTGALSFSTVGCQPDTSRSDEPGSPPDTNRQEPGSPPAPQQEPGSPPEGQRDPGPVPEQPRDGREPGS